MADTPIRKGEPKCIYCGSFLIAADVVHHQPTANGFIKTKIGTCFKCEKPYCWEEHYVYKGFSNLSEEN